MTEYFLKGEKIGLRPYKDEDFKEINRWVNDEKTTFYMFTGQRPTSLSASTSIYREQFENSSNVVFIVEDLQTQLPIGMAGLYDINPTARKAEFRILLGEGRGKGLGTETTKLVTDYGFDRLNMNRIFLGVTEENAGAVRAYKKAGYKVEGILKDDLYRNGRYYNSIRMAVLLRGTQ